MSFDKRIIKVWKLCEDYNDAVLSVQFHMPGMQKKKKKKKKKTDWNPSLHCSSN